MADDPRDRKCAHGPCECTADPDSKFCSEYCKDIEDTGVVEITCGCTHRGCRG